MNEDLIRKLQIALLDSVSLQKRRKYIEEGIPVFCLLKEINEDNDHYQDAIDVLNWLEKDSRNGIIWYGEDNYPDFSPIERRVPYVLFYKGTFLKNRKSISIVGTRQVDNEGFQAAFKLGYEASINDISVVSGLADGCDQAALSGAVLGLCPSFGVLGCGIEYDYPSYTGVLKSKMIDSGGALISRFPPFYPPLKQNFPNRNLIISAMGLCTVVIQAPRKSGSLITSDFSLQMGKDVYVSEAGVGQLRSRYGTDQLISDGAPVIDSVCQIMPCKYRVFETTEEKGVRFGNKRYFLRNNI